MPQKVNESMLDDDARLHKYVIRWDANYGTNPIPIDLGSIEAKTITKAIFQTDAGTINVHFEIDNGGGYTDIEFDGGDELLPASSTAATENAESANVLNAGGSLQMLLDSPLSSPTLVSVDLFYRTNVV